MFPKAIKENNCSIEKCSRRCDICKKISKKRKETQVQKLRGTLTCKTKNIVYLIACKWFSATGFKEKFQIHKSGIETGKIRCGIANLLLNVCESNICKTK